jgi:predicted Zn-dependent protease
LRKPRSSLAALVVVALLALQPSATKANGLSLIRDAEIENTIRIYAAPLFRAAALDPEAISVYLVQDESLNAFVVPGLRMFLHTGLLIRAEDPLQVIGVIAHETGHLAAGHTVTRGETIREAQNTAIAAAILGLAAALATGRGEFAAIGLRGGQDVALRNLLSYNRTQESAADLWAIRLLRETGQSPAGLLEFMRILGGQEVLYAGSQDPYLRTHPLAQERISYLSREVSESPFANREADPELLLQHARMRAKLIGFLRPYEQVLIDYPESDGSLPGRYARAIASFRKGDLEAALAGIDGLIAAYPEDPYFHELKGQVLFESGRVADALAPYRQAHALLPRSPLIALSLAQVSLEMNQPEHDREGLRLIKAALRDEPDNAFGWRLAAVAHGRQGDIGETALALSEAALIRGKYGEAVNQAQRAKKILGRDETSWQRADDIESLARHRQKSENNRN